MALHREIEGKPVRPEPIERVDGRHERRRAEASWQLASATLACRACDAPLLPEPGGMTPSDPIACGFCRHSGFVRDFLSLAQPPRATQVAVRIRGLALR